jgi:toxin CptA
MDVSLFLAMSIAVTVVVRPSRFLNALLRGMCLCVALVGIAIGFAWVSDLSLLYRLPISVACILTATACLHAKFNRDTYQISISGDGQIRLSEYDVVLDATIGSARDDASGKVFLVDLQDNSIIWPLLLLLHLKADNEKTFIVPIFSDGLSASGFRSLSVACRWIAIHNKSAKKVS